MDKQKVQHTTLACHELRNALIVVWSSFWSGNISVDNVCREREGTIPGGRGYNSSSSGSMRTAIAKWGGAAFPRRIFLKIKLLIIID